MPKAIRVIVFTARQTKNLVCETLLGTKYKKGEDWIFANNNEDVERLVIRGRPQLIVTNGLLKSTVLVMKMKRYNHALKAACISTIVGRNSEQYQYCVQQTNGRDFTGLMEIMAHYLDLVTPQPKKA